jgi:hypothetical protein
MNIWLVLLIFGNLTDIFTNRTFDLCKLNFTMFDSVCPANVQLTPDNFFTEYSYVFNLFLAEFYFICLM